MLIGGIDNGLRTGPATPSILFGIGLEEVESTRVAADAWLITLSMTMADLPLSSIVAVLGNGKREYKTFTVFKETGSASIAVSTGSLFFRSLIGPDLVQA